MVEPRRELVRSWLAKALHELGTARKAAADPDPYRDTAVYHCQQAAEKTLKAWTCRRLGAAACAFLWEYHS